MAAAAIVGEKTSLATKGRGQTAKRRVTSHSEGGGRPSAKRSRKGDKAGDGMVLISGDAEGNDSKEELGLASLIEKMYSKGYSPGRELGGAPALDPLCQSCRAQCSYAHKARSECA